MSFEFHINGNQTTFFILFVLRSCTFGFADYKKTQATSKHSSWQVSYLDYNVTVFSTFPGASNVCWYNAGSPNTSSALSKTSSSFKLFINSPFWK